MENNKNTKIFLYIAGACFAAIGVLYAIYVISYVISGWSWDGYASFKSGWSLIGHMYVIWEWPLNELLLCIAFLVMAVSLFLEKPVLTVIGSAIGVAEGLWSLIRTIIVCTRIWFFGHSFIRLSCVAEILIFLFSLMLLIAAIEVLQRKKGANILCFAAAVAMLLSRLFNTIANRTYYKEFHYNFIGWMNIILPIVAAILLGIFVGSLPVKESTVQPVAPTGDVDAISAESRIDRLVKLKELLDSGIITKEELEEKKKDILEI